MSLKPYIVVRMRQSSYSYIDYGDFENSVISFMNMGYVCVGSFTITQLNDGVVITQAMQLKDR